MNGASDGLTKEQELFARIAAEEADRAARAAVEAFRAVVERAAFHAERSCQLAEAQKDENLETRKIQRGFMLKTLEAHAELRTSHAVQMATTRALSAEVADLQVVALRIEMAVEKLSEGKEALDEGRTIVVESAKARASDARQLATSAAQHAEKLRREEEAFKARQSNAEVVVDRLVNISLSIAEKSADLAVEKKRNSVVRENKFWIGLGTFALTVGAAVLVMLQSCHH